MEYNIDDLLKEIKFDFKKDNGKGILLNSHEIEVLQRYGFDYNITDVSTEWKHVGFDFSVSGPNESVEKAMLAFYGIYGTGNKPSVKNVRFYIVPNYTDEQVVKNLTSEKDGEVTLYANWEPNKYNVVFNKNAENATGTMENQQFTYGQAQNLTENGFSRVGYEV